MQMQMSSMYVALATGVLVWWVVVRQLTARPWEPAEAPRDVASGLLDLPAKRVGLFAFLAVASSLFLILIAAYVMRMHHGSWAHLGLPPVLWLNTALLVGASAALHAGKRALARGRRSVVVGSHAIAGLLTIAFLAGQVSAWQDIAAAGHYLTGSPATAFFYVLTTLHGLHLLGGLWVWARTALRLARGAELVDVRLSIELCSVYWHYLLAVWLVLFAVLALT